MTPPPADEKRPDARTAEALWRAWRERGDAAARDRLVLSYAPMVKYLAFRKGRELPAHCDVDDLVSAGLLALLASVERFDPARGASFEQFAWTRVSGAIVDELRSQDWAPRSVRRSERAIERARERVQARAGRPASDAELARELDVSREELDGRLADLERADVASLSAPVRGAEETGEIGDAIEAPGGDHDPVLAALRAEHADVLRGAITSLSERDQTVLVLLYVRGLSGAEVGSVLGVSESRVSQLLAGIRRRLRQQLDAYERDDALAA